MPEQYKPPGVGEVGVMRDAPFEERVLCPRCWTRLLPVTYPGALSRVDNATEVCSECGLHEALSGLARHPETQQETTDDWPVSYMPGGLGTRAPA